ncbi:hypothetical protein AVEN_274578-1 [Araneus ventricosus]|uniref:Uncharacterized protein n=1 Tax=Araneus ventricosus TaxID=182803 RepID=A0A4Y2T4M3_ARAVE|nr:hypothetical protein AVEN_274578-1 [Araneus ventricosus]
MSRYLSSGEFPARLWLEIVISAVSEFTCHLAVSRSHLALSSWRLQNFSLLLSSRQIRIFHLISVILAADGFPLVPVISAVPGLLPCVCHLGVIRLSTSFLSSQRLMASHSFHSSWRFLAFSLLYVIFTAADFPPRSCHLSD